ncbi:thiolase-like protein [Triangularia verruculosa]|uniref:Thiolase-like protein n=1 Tax=Triangularia verruculosa TaxID=2587418 RepID=A0AAN6XI80_9PEZI|nr:thiolase-like protein [Triangularia verruculosa]
MSVSTEPRELGLSILGLGTQYPPYSLDARALEVLSKRYHPESPAMQKVLAINRYTGIDKRSSIGRPDHWLVNQPEPPTISQIHDVFMSDGVPLAISASKKALAEAHVDDISQITHMVSTTCTDSANPGYDHFVAKSLGLSTSVEKVLLHGVGCSGGLAALRTAANLCLGHSMRGLPARILVLALEISTTLVRSELDSIHQDQETRIGICLFSDCASAVVLSNDIPFSATEPIPPPVYSLLDWRHQTIPDTESDLGFDTHTQGWKVVLSPRVPNLTASVLEPTYNSLLSGKLLPEGYDSPKDFDWAMHPGGATILTGAEKVLGIQPEHMRASYDTYVNHGNSSSATIFSVLNRLREKEMDGVTPGGRGPKEMVVGCAFGPGITVEMCLLKRNLSRTEGGARKGMETPPEMESSSEEGELGSEEGSDVVDGEQEGGKGKDKKAEEFIEKALESVELD